MTNAIRSLLAASAAAALLAAPTARAHDCDEDGRLVPPAPPPAAYPAPMPGPGALVRPIEWGPRRDGPFAELRAEYARLELARQRFYAGWRGNPWTQRRFETWQAVRRAELDRRSEWLTQRAAWQEGHRPRGNAWGWRHGDRDDD